MDRPARPADPVPALLLGAVFAVLGTGGFWWVRRRGQLGWAVAYVAVQLPLAFVIFSIDPVSGRRWVPVHDR